jgi:WxcM-like, C-terminal
MDSIRTTINDCTLIHFPKIKNRAGNLTPLHSEKDIPFKFKRIFYLYDVPGGEDRGAHSHKKCHQLLIAASGSFDIFLDDGRNKKTISLNRPYMGLHIPPGIWAAEQSFSSGSICLVLASEYYNENDYLRKYKEYIKFKEI